MPPAFKDHFSQAAGDYAAYRPHYPAALIDWLATLAPASTTVWDCACGSGQASTALAGRFAAVQATDASAAQLAQAKPHPRIQYRVANAEASGLENGSVGLVTVAQALHWFDIDRFYAEAGRVLAPGGVLAVWSYGITHVEGQAIDRLVQQFHGVTLDAYWPPERRLVEAGYRGLPFPFDELPPPAFTMQADWTLEQLLGYFSSWSAVARYRAARGDDPLIALGAALQPLWGDPARTRRVSWPLALRVGVKPAAAHRPDA